MGIGYYNLYVGSSWVIQNLSVDPGLSQTFSAMFDLGVVHGTDVSTLLYGASIDNAPLRLSPHSSGRMLSRASPTRTCEDGSGTSFAGNSPDIPDASRGVAACELKGRRNL